MFGKKQNHQHIFSRISEVKRIAESIKEDVGGMVKCHATKFYIDKADAVAIPVYKEERKEGTTEFRGEAHQCRTGLVGSISYSHKKPEYNFEFRRVGVRYFHPEHAPKGVDHILIDRHGVEGEVVINHPVNQVRKLAVASLENVVEKKKKRPYKRQFMKDCYECGGKFKGNVGLAIHQKRAHGITKNDN